MTLDERIERVGSLSVLDIARGRGKVLAEELRRARKEEVDGIAYILAKLRVGDLVEAGRRDTVHLPEELASRMERSAGALAGQIQHIQDQSLEVAVVGSEVQATSADLASGFSEQSAAVVEITATIEELARTAAQIAQNAEHQAELSDKALSDGADGAQAVLAATEGLEGLRARIGGIAKKADSLGSRSKEIYRILDLINEIAHDTHILSLNAAIEAETAGEHGRRFAVVAEEVRRLAQRARESVQSVRVHLEEFSGAIRSTVVATEEGSKEADLVLEQARAAHEAIDELRSALAETTRAAREISLATREQRTASDQVAITIKEVREVIQRMADGLRNFTSTAEDLNELALTIQLVTQAFRFASPRSLKHVLQERADRFVAMAGDWSSADRELKSLVDSGTYIEFAYLVDGHGTMLACAVSSELSSGRLPQGVEIGKNYSERPWFQSVQKGGSSTITPLYDSLLTGQKCFTVAAPVALGDGSPAAVLAADVNLRSWVRI